MMGWRVYFDGSDDQMDGHGWNVVQGHSAIAARFRTAEEAIAYLSKDIEEEQRTGGVK